MAARAHDVTPVRAALVVLVAVATQACGSDRAEPRRAERSPAPSPGAAASTSPVPPAGLRRGPPRTHDEVVAAISGRRVRVEGRTIRVDPGTVACGGIGDATGRVNARPGWTRFRCIQPTFPHGSVAGPDLVFVVASAAPRRLVVEHPRLTRY